uniref:Uncharacterized protein n=1 Tax=Rhizophora mucronata TaxID=61149 RepID=A0A2P2N4C5_RHIMU
MLISIVPHIFHGLLRGPTCKCCRYIPNIP